MWSCSTMVRMSARAPAAWQAARFWLPQQQHPPRCRKFRFASGPGNQNGGSNGSSGAASSSEDVSTSSGGSDPSRPPLAPWTLTFDLRERETLWTEENQARLVRIVAGYQLDLDVEEVEQRLRELAVLLPHLASRIAYIKPSTLAGLLRDPGALVPRLITLRQLLPAIDISAMAAAEPELLLLRDLAELQADLARLRQLLGANANLDAILQQQPRFLDAELVREVLEELKRLMPGKDAVVTLLSDPSWLLRVERGTKRLGDHPDM